MKILLVDDDEYLAELLKNSLAKQHYAVDAVADGEAGWHYGSTFAYDAIVLDVMLPKLDGISLCKRLRDRGYRLPILLLTVRDNSTDIIKGLDAGADDYVVKPCEFEELMARIRALLRREKQTVSPILQRENLCLDSNSCEVTYRGNPVSLTPTEYALLELFLRYSYRVFNRSEIIDRLWSSAECPSDDTLRTHIKGLRQKLQAVGADRDTIETVYGIGYRLKPLPERSQTKTTIPESSIAQDSKRIEHEAALVEVWEQCKDKLVARLDVLEEAAQILDKQNRLDPKLQQQAEREVHTLAGTLGVFGLREAVRLARQLEQLLQKENPLEPERAVLFKVFLSALRWEMGIMPTTSTIAPTTNRVPWLLIVNDDRAFSERLADVATAKNFRPAIASSPQQAKDWLDRNRPDVALIELSLTQSDVIEKLAYQTPSIPVLVLADGGSLADRIEATNQGADVFLEQPISAEDAIEAAMQSLESNRIKANGRPSWTEGQGCDAGKGSGISGGADGEVASPYKAPSVRRNFSFAKIAIVDDDPQLLASLPKLLAPWGLESIALQDPQHLSIVLNAFAPDLLVLDAVMPDVNGFDLCRVLRRDRRWNSLPIVFLSDRTDSQTQDRAFASGADDCISKSIPVPQLANRILNRLERVKSRMKFK